MERFCFASLLIATLLASAQSRPAGDAKLAPAENLMLGKFELESDPASPDYEAYLKEMKVNDDYRAILTRIPINIEILKMDTGYMYRIITPVVTKELAFNMDQDIPDNYVDGRKYTTTFRLEGIDTIIQTLKFDSFESQNKFLFQEESMTGTLYVNDVRAVRKYKRVKEFTPFHEQLLEQERRHQQMTQDQFQPEPPKIAEKVYEKKVQEPKPAEQRVTAPEPREKAPEPKDKATEPKPLIDSLQVQHNAHPVLTYRNPLLPPPQFLQHYHR